MKMEKQLCARGCGLLALGIALAGALPNQHFLVLLGISLDRDSSPWATWSAAICSWWRSSSLPRWPLPSWPFTTTKSSQSCAIFSSIWQLLSLFLGHLVAFFPAGFQGLLQQFMRLFFAITILASALLSAALLALPLPAKWVVPASAVFLLLGQVRLPILRFGTLTVGMCLCLLPAAFSLPARVRSPPGCCSFPAPSQQGSGCGPCCPFSPFM